MNKIRIGTRGSTLALWQAKHVASLISNSKKDLEVEIVSIKTEGDQRQDVPLADIGGKGLFIKELENALVDRRIDIAVHSMKDVTVNLADEFQIPVILKRENPFDALVSNRYQSVDELPSGARVGTCSPRRRSQLLSLRSDLQVLNLRGNVTTRLNRLDNGDFDAVILAVAGLRRLELEYRIRQILSVEDFVPSPGQGALGIECRADDTDVKNIIESLNDTLTFDLVQAEREANRLLGGNCHMPLGIYASLHDKEECSIKGWAGLLDGSDYVSVETVEYAGDPLLAAASLADSMIESGAQKILDACLAEN